LILSAAFCILCSIQSPGRNTLSGLDGISYGLSFQSYEVTQDERTSLDLTPHSGVDASKGFCIEFDMKIKEGFCFGYIFRFIDDKLNHLDFCSNHNAKRFNFIFGDDDDVISNIDLPMEDGCAQHHIKVRIPPGGDCFLCSVDSVTVSVPVGGSRLGKFKFQFGCIDNDRYYSSDLPHYTLKNVVLYGGRGKMIASWPMAAHTENAVYDTLGYKKAVVRNPVWNIDDHAKWTRREVFNLPVGDHGVTFSDDGNNVFIMLKDKMIVYFTKDGHSEYRESVQGTMPAATGNQLMFDAADDILLAASGSDSGIYFYSLSFNFWKKVGEGMTPPFNNHQGMYFDNDTHTAYFVAGYGMHEYFNDVCSFDFDGESVWKRDTIAMTPRYMCAVGKYGDRILIIGGMGSRTGRQEMDPHNLYDILSVDFRTGICDTLSYIKRPEGSGQFVFSPDLVSAIDQNLVYTLIFDNETFNSAAHLVSLNPHDGTLSYFDEQIPFKFQDLCSYCRLFRGGADGNTLYAVLTQPQGDSGYEVSIYSMSYPPLKKEDIIEKDRLRPVEYAGIGALVVLAILLAIFFSRRKRDKELIIPAMDMSVKAVKPSKSFIRLLGGFQVVDAVGNDISSKFSPILKGLLSYIILRYSKDGKGISTSTLDMAFWPDMERVKALNNRRVNLSRLRTLLLQVGPISIDSCEGYVNLQISSPVYCDYLALNDALHNRIFKDIISIGSLGPLLPDLNYDCIYEFKSELTFNLSDMLNHFDKSGERDNLMNQIYLSNVVLLQDPVDENAISVKCRALYTLGQKGLSKSTFDSFVSQYRSLLGSDPDFSYSDLF